MTIQNSVAQPALTRLNDSKQDVIILYDIDLCSDEEKMKKSSVILEIIEVLYEILEKVSFIWTGRSTTPTKNLVEKGKRYFKD